MSPRHQTRPVTSRWANSPRTSVSRYGALVGESALVERLAALLEGEELTAELGYVLAGPASRSVLAGGEGGPAGYWSRVWALRGLLYVFNATASSHVAAACADSAWRVREMASRSSRPSGSTTRSKTRRGVRMTTSRECERPRGALSRLVSENPMRRS